MNYKNKLLLLSCFFSATAFAESSEYTLEPVVVTATRTSQALEQNIAPVIVITHEEIEQSHASDVAEVLRSHAGLEVSRYGGPGQPASLFIRGTESDHVLLMIDGVKTNPGTISGPMWQLISPHMIERIEIVKGPRSSLYGSEALGGVVNIITKRATQELQWHAAAEVGAQNTQKYSGSYHTKQSLTRLGLNAEWFSTDGFPPRETQDFGGEYKNNSIDAYFGYGINDFDIEAAASQSQGNTHYVAYDENYMEAPRDYDFKNTITSLTTKYHLHRWDQTLKLSRVTDELYQNQITRIYDSNGSLIESWDYGITKRNALDWQNDIKISKDHLLTAGLYLSDEHTASMSYGDHYDEDTTTNAMYAQSNSRFGHHRFVVAGRLTDHEDFGVEDSYNADYGWDINPKLSVLAGVGKGFRAPNATERFGSSGNPDLNPETSINIELGLKSRFSQNHRGTISLFQNEIKNMIVYYDPDAYEGPLRGRMENIGRARIQGIEFGYNYQQQPLSFHIEGIVQNPQDLDNRQMLLRRAKRSLTGQLSYNKNTTTYGIEGLYSSNRKDFGDADLPAYGIVNLFVSENLANNFSVGLKIENLFDRKYQLVEGYNTQGLLALVQIKYSSPVK